MSRSEPILIEGTFKSTLAKAWSALTNKDEMKEWYFDLLTFRAEIGFEFHFEGGKDPENPYLHICVITEVVDHKKITYSWRYAGYPGISYVSFELVEKGDKIKVILTHEGLETFSPSVEDFNRENFVMGWTHIVNTSLKGYLENTNK